MSCKLIMLGIVLMLICVGLSGCEEVGIGISNIGDINANPDEFYGKEVTIEGNCGSYYITDDSEHKIHYVYSNTLSGKYRLTGIVTEGIKNPFIEVTKAKAF